MERFQRNCHLLSIYPKLNNRQQKLIQQNLDLDQVKFICELCINIIEKTLPLDKKSFDKLKRHKQKIRKLANPKFGLNCKRKLVQSGGFIPLLLSTLAGSALDFILEKYLGNGERKTKNS